MEQKSPSGPKSEFSWRRATDGGRTENRSWIGLRSSRSNSAQWILTIKKKKEKKENPPTISAGIQSAKRRSVGAILAFNVRRLQGDGVTRPQPSKYFKGFRPSLWVVSQDRTPQWWEDTGVSHGGRVTQGSQHQKHIREGSLGGFKVMMKVWRILILCNK